MLYAKNEMFSAIAADHIQNRRNFGPLEGATHFGHCGTRGEGPYVEIWLIIREDRILTATYRTPGCPSSIACASVLCQIATGRSPAQLGGVTPGDLSLIVGKLPEGREFYAGIAVSALQSAIAGEDTQWQRL